MFLFFSGAYFAPLLPPFTGFGNKTGGGFQHMSGVKQITLFPGAANKLQPK